MQCQNCGFHIEEGEKFCGNCGAPIKVQPADVFETLIMRAKQSDAEAIAEIYKKTYSQVYYVVKSMIKDEDTINDILQDSYIKAFSHLDSFIVGHDFLPWIKQIAANTARDYLKKKKPTLFTELGGETENYEFENTLVDNQRTHMPEEMVDQRETARLLQEILDELPEDQRAAIGMYYYEELSVKQIAEAFGVSESAVKSRLMYGRKKIEAKVLDLEKKGTKLYSLAPFAFFLLLLKKQKVQAAELMPNPRILQRVISHAVKNGAANMRTKNPSGHTAPEQTITSDQAAAGSKAANAGKAATAGKAAAAGKAVSGGIGIGKIAMIAAAVVVLGAGSFFATSKVIANRSGASEKNTAVEEMIVEAPSVESAETEQRTVETKKEAETKKVLTDEEMTAEAMALYQTIINKADSYDYHLDGSESAGKYFYAFVKMSKEDKVPALLLKEQTADARFYVKIFKYDEQTGEVHEASESLIEKTTLLQRMNDGEGIKYTNFSQGTGDMEVYRILLSSGEITKTTEYTGNVMDEQPASLAATDITWYDISQKEGIDNWEKDTAEVTQQTSSDTQEPAPAEADNTDTMPTDGDRLVLTGTVRYVTYDEMIELQGPDPNGAYGGHDQTWVLIIFDSPQMVTATNGDGYGQRTSEAWCINAGDTLGEYSGQRITFSIDPNMTWFPSDTGLPLGQPSTTDIHVLQ